MNLHNLAEHASRLPGPLGWIAAAVLTSLACVVDVAQHGAQTTWVRVLSLPSGVDLYFPVISQITPSGIAAGILAITAAAVVAGGQISALWINHIRKRNEAHLENLREVEKAQRESLGGQLAAANENYKALRKSLHEQRDEAYKRDLRHREDLLALQDTIKSLQSVIGSLRSEVESLRVENARLRGGQDHLQTIADDIDDTTRRIEQKADTLSNTDIPVYRPDQEPKS